MTGTFAMLNSSIPSACGLSHRPLGPVCLRRTSFQFQWAQNWWPATAQGEDEVRASAGDWAAYAADVARRTTTED